MSLSDHSPRVAASPRLAVVRRAAFFAAVAWPVGSVRAGVLDPVGPVGVGDKVILFDSLAIMLAVIIPVILMTLGFAWWFRASNTKAKHLPDWEYSGRIELVVWSIPAMVVLFLGGVAWVGSHELDPRHALASTQPPLKVEVVSMDWKWLFIYPDQGVASVNRLTIPVGVPVEFDLTSADVMNSFFVPRLGSQIYTMAGMVTHINLQADEPGTFPGISAQFSGDGFSDMRFDTVAVPAGQFADWVAHAKSSKSVLDQTAYDALAKPSQANRAADYSGVPSGLFDRIVAQSAPGSDMGATSGPMAVPANATPAKD